MHALLQILDAGVAYMLAVTYVIDECLVVCLQHHQKIRLFGRELCDTLNELLRLAERTQSRYLQASANTQTTGVTAGENCLGGRDKVIHLHLA